MVGVRERERVWLGVRDAATPKSAKESMVTVPVPVAEPKHAFIHTEGRLSRIPVVAGMPPVDQVWKLPAIPIVALAATLVHVLPLLVLYQNWYGIGVELTLMYPTTLPSLPTCTWVNPVVDVFIITPPHVEVAAWFAATPDHPAGTIAMSEANLPTAHEVVMPMLRANVHELVAVALQGLWAADVLQVDTKAKQQMSGFNTRRRACGVACAL